MKTYHVTDTYDLEFPDCAFVEAIAEICPNIKFDAEGRLSVDKGCMYQRNGDPGWPPSRDEEKSVTALYINGVRVYKEDYPLIWELCEKQFEKEEINYEKS